MIFNPAAGRGRGRKLVPRYLELLAEHLHSVDHDFTERPGDERRLADRAVAGGYDTVVAMGGDGTFSHVADRLLAAERDVRFGVLPAGTGNDFGRNLGMDVRDLEGAVRALARGRTRRVDVGRIVTPAGRVEPGAGGGTGERPASRHFLNVVGFGFDVAVIDAAAGARLLRGELLYKVSALQQLFRFPGFDVSLGNGERTLLEGETLMLTVSNGCHFGGGFPIAPDAEVDDGALHACRVGDAAPLTRFMLFNKAERGRHGTSERVELHRAPRFTVDFAEPPRFEADGDLFVAEASTVELEVVPGALEVVAPLG